MWKVNVSGLPLVEDRTYTKNGVKRAWISPHDIPPERLAAHEPGSEHGVTYDLPGGKHKEWLPPRTAAIDYEDTDRYVTCERGCTHWGAAGAAGLLIRHQGDDGQHRYLLQHRSPYVQHGGTWSTPGGALAHGESPEEGAKREAEEEFGSLPHGLRHHHTFTDDHGGTPGWKYHTVVMDSPCQFSPGGAEGDWETQGHGWFTPAEMKGLQLHPGFAASWEKVRKSGAVQKNPEAWQPGTPLYHGSLREHPAGTVLTPGGKDPGGSVFSGDYVYATTSPEAARYFGSMHDDSPRSDRDVHVHRVEPVGDVEPDDFPAGAEDERYAHGNYRAKALRVLDHRVVPGHWTGTAGKTAALPGREVREYEGRAGDPSHITRSELGLIPTSAVAGMRGARGEVPGEHRNRQGAKWEEFKRDIGENGIRSPLFVTVDHGEEPKLSEGNHRRDAAVELGLPHVPVEIRYFGHAEQQGLVEDRAGMRREGAASYEIKFEPDYHGRHRVSAWPSGYQGDTTYGELLGSMQWHPESGMITQLHVRKSRSGIGTALWRKAHEEAARNGIAAPTHSPSRTPAANAWAQFVGGETPPLSPGSQDPAWIASLPESAQFRPKTAAYGPELRTVQNVSELGWGDEEWAAARREPWHAAAKLAQHEVRQDHPKLTMRFPDQHNGGDEMVGHILRYVGYQGDVSGAFVSRHPDPSRRTSNPAWLDGAPGVALHPERWDYGTVAHEAAHHAVMHDHAAAPNEHQPDEQVHGPEWAGHYAQGLNRISKGAGDDFLDHHRFYRGLIDEGLQLKRPSGMDAADRRHREQGGPIVREGAAEGTTIRMVAPEEYRKYAYPDYPAKGLPALARHLRKLNPAYYQTLRDKIAEAGGVDEPVLARFRQNGSGRPLKQPQMMNGHHRAAIASELGLHLPVGDYDNQADYEHASRIGQPWFAEHGELKAQGRSPWRAEAAYAGDEGPATDGPWYHGTNVDIGEDNPVKPGYRKHFGEGKSTHVYFTESEDGARKYANWVAGNYGGEPHVYEVRPESTTGWEPVGGSRAEGVPREYKTRSWLRTVREMPDRSQPMERLGGGPRPDYDPSEELPEGRGIWYRAHDRRRPLDEAHARSAPLNHGYRPFQVNPAFSVGQRGYSSFASPHELSSYMDEMEWKDTDSWKHRDAIAFHGKHVGVGEDNEPLVVPEANPRCCGRVIHTRMPWDEFEGKLWHGDYADPDSHKYHNPQELWRENNSDHELSERRLKHVYQRPPEVKSERRHQEKEERRRQAATGYENLTKGSGMIYLDLPEGAVRHLPGGVDEHHVTICYLGRDVDDKTFAEACRRAKEAASRSPLLSGTIEGIKTFPPSDSSDGKTVAYVPVLVRGLSGLRHDVESLSASQHKDFTPHITLGYLEEGEDLPAPHPPVKVSFDRLFVKRGDDVVSFPFGSEKA